MVRYIHSMVIASDAERERVRKSALYAAGDTILVWASEADLVAFGECMNPREPTTEEMKEALLAYSNARRWATGTEEHRKAIERADYLNPLRDSAVRGGMR